MTSGKRMEKNKSAEPCRRRTNPLVPCKEAKNRLRKKQARGLKMPPTPSILLFVDGIFRKARVSMVNTPFFTRGLTVNIMPTEKKQSDSGIWRVLGLRPSVRKAVGPFAVPLLFAEGALLSSQPVELTWQWPKKTKELG